MFKGKFLFPAGLPDGGYRIIADIDNTNAVTNERFETNNLALGSQLVGIRAPFVNFTGSIFKHPTSISRPVGTASILLRNTGNTKTLPTVFVRVLLSNDNVYDLFFESSIGGGFVKADLKPNASRVISMKFPTQANIARGTYHLIFEINPGFSRSESISTDNIIISAPINFI